MPFQIVRANSINIDAAVNGLDDRQRACVECPDTDILIKAPAGSGKTTTLIAAIAQYKYENLNSHVCAITFTNAAADEINTRLQQVGIYDVEASTIHVWAKRQLERLSRKHNFSIQSRLLSDADSKQILDRLLHEYFAGSHTRMSESTKARCMNVTFCHMWVFGNKKMNVYDTQKKVWNRIEEEYISYKKVNQLYDFTDYPLYLYDKIVEYGETIDDIDGLFVDEFQDVDPTQFALFKQYTHADKRFFIGDSWQSIYIFRNADGEVFNKLSDFTVFDLSYNYRSYQEIIDFATSVYNYFSSDIEAKNKYVTRIPTDTIVPSSVTCSRGYGGHVYWVNPYGRSFESHQQEICESGTPRELVTYFIRKGAVILCRTNKQVKALQELGYVNAMTIHQAKGLEYDYVIVVDNTMISESDIEDLNVAYVALTRAKDEILVINWVQLEAEMAAALKAALI